MSARAFFGIILVVIGGGWLLDRAGMFDFGSLIATWWPLVLIALAALQIVTRSAPLIGSLIVLGVGAVFQAITLGLLPGNVWSVIWPLALVAIGAWLLLSRGAWMQPTIHSDERLNSFVIFGGANPRSESGAFEGGSVTAIFAGTEVDLRGATLAASGAELDVSAAFGGVEVIVPSSWRVAVSGLPIFGGWENKTQHSAAGDMGDAPMLKINCLAAFGAIDVHN
jgi:predicted membrane protein